MEPNKSHNSTSLVKQKLETAYLSRIKNERATVFLRALLILFSGATAWIISEQIWYLSPLYKSLFLIALVSATIYMIWRGTTSRNQSQSFSSFYRTFSRKSDLPELKDTLDLEQNILSDQRLVEAAILQNLSKVEEQKLDESLAAFLKSSAIHKQFRQLSIIGAFMSVALLSTAINFNEAAKRSLTFWKAYTQPNPYSYTIVPANVTVEQGSPFQVQINFKGVQIPEEVSLRIKTSVEDDYRTQVMEANGTTYASITQDLNTDLQYYVEMDGFKSEVYLADVQLRPRFNTLQAKVIPPAYTQLEPSLYTYPISQIRAYQGSTVELSGAMNKKISFLQLSTSTEFLDLFVQPDSTFSYEMPIVSNDTLQFHIEDSNGLTNQNTFQIILASQADEYPIVELLEPREDLREVNPSSLDLMYRATDDFGLTSATLYYELKRAYVEKPTQGSITLPTPSQGILEPYSWTLDSFKLKPQDELSFWVSVQDNDGFNGFKSSRSQTLSLMVPSLVDYFDEVDDQENNVKDELDEVSKAFEETQQQYEQFKEKMKDNPERNGYEEKRELEQVQKQQEEVQKKIEELNKKFEELKEEMSADNMLSEETQQAYEELQKLMEEIDDPAFREALQKMQEQLSQMSPDQMRQAMEELEFNEELYKERLERTIELFKQLKLNSDLDKLAKSFEDMARKEDEGVSDAAQQQDNLKKSLDENKKLQEQVESLSENASEKNEKEIKEFQKQTQSELNELSQEMQESMQNEPSTQQQQKRKQTYEQLAEQTKSLMQAMNKKQMNVNIAGLQYVLYSLLNLSLEQEDLTTLASATENRSQAYVVYARDQKNVDEIFNFLSDSLYQLSTEIPQFSNQINKKKLEVKERLNRSLTQMSERNRNQSSIASRQALGGINDISFMIANLLEQLQDQQNGGGQGGGGMSMQQMMEQLGQTGEQQQKLNQMMQDMINDLQGERLSQDQMQRLDQMAQQQNRIRKQLQQLQQQGNAQGDKIGSELERMIEDMENTINDLRGGSIDPLMIERQQNILSRMLEAEEALQERDEEDKREGDAADNFERSTPPELTLEELEKQIRSRLNDPNFTKYAPDYQRLIENYFELLKRLQDRES